jgi:hypothetical protein
VGGFERLADVDRDGSRFVVDRLGGWLLLVVVMVR